MCFKNVKKIVLMFVMFGMVISLNVVFFDYNVMGDIEFDSLVKQGWM